MLIADPSRDIPVNLIHQVRQTAGIPKGSDGQSGCGMGHTDQAHPLAHTAFSHNLIDGGSDGRAGTELRR